MNAEKIRKKREELGLTQSELATLIGVSLRTIQNYEKDGVIPSSKYEILRNVLNAGNGNITGDGNIDVKLIRKRMRISQEELGKLIGVSRNTIANYENGGVIPDSKVELLSKLMNRDVAVDKIMDVIAGEAKTLEPTAEKSATQVDSKGSNTEDYITLPREVWEMFKAQLQDANNSNKELFEIIKSLRAQLETKNTAGSDLSKAVG